MSRHTNAEHYIFNSKFFSTFIIATNAILSSFIFIGHILYSYQRKYNHTHQFPVKKCFAIDFNPFYSFVLL